MERLTERTTCGVPNLAYPKSCYFQDGAKDPVAASAYRQQAIERLAAYEDIGLEPEEIKELIYRFEKCRVIRAALCDPTGQPIADPAHMRDLIKAEKDGRLVVLPCKVGDTVWRIYDDCDFPGDCGTKMMCDECEYRNLFIEKQAFCISMLSQNGRLGHPYYKSREEAEAALAEKGRNYE